MKALTENSEFAIAVRASSIDLPISCFAGVELRQLGSLMPAMPRGGTAQRNCQRAGLQATISEVGLEAMSATQQRIALAPFDACRCGMTKPSPRRKSVKLSVRQCGENWRGYSSPEIARWKLMRHPNRRLFLARQVCEFLPATVRPR